jgi:hypothetical protein
VATCLCSTSCQPDFYSSSDSSDQEEFGFEENEDNFESDAELSDRSEPGDSIRISELEAFEKFRENNWKCIITANKLLQEVTHDSLKHLSSQGDKVKEKKVRQLTKKLERLKPNLYKLINREDKVSHRSFLSLNPRKVFVKI